MNTHQRLIGHVDMDAFFVSVELLTRPQLRGKAVVVGGREGRGVVASASYEARRFGVRSAMPMAQALRLCRHLEVIEPNFPEYSRLSKLVFAEMKSVAPLVEQVSIDEAYLDFTGCEKIYPDPQALGHLIKRRILKVSGLTCTVGLATNKLLAKIASDAAKPDGVLVIEAGSEAGYLAPLPVTRLPGIGGKTAEQLERLGIKRVEDILKPGAKNLKPVLGSYAATLERLARGIDERTVSEDHEPKSFGSERTFSRDVGDLQYLFETLREMAEELATDLRRNGLKAQTIQIKMRYPDFSTQTRAKSLEEPTYFSDQIAHEAQELLRLHKIPQINLRLLGVSVRNFSNGQQLNLFAADDQRREALENVKDQLKTRFGKKILKSSSELRRNKEKEKQ